MAWNEPGGSGSKDPWGGGGGGGGKQGPPDLDQVIKNIQAKFGGLFGSGGGGGGTAAGFNKILILAVLAGILVWAGLGIYSVEEGKRAVVLQFGAYQQTTLPGLHWFPRLIQSIEKVDISSIRSAEVGYRSGGTRGQGITAVEREALMLTQDENIVDIEVAVQYKVKSAKDYLFNVRDPDITLRQVTESAVRELIGKSKMDFVLTEGRAEIGERVEQKIQEILDFYTTGLLVTSLNMQNAQPPEQVQHAFADAVKAREDEERAKNMAEAYANDIIPRARGGAARQLAEADAYKSEVIARAEGETSRFLKVLAEYEKAPRVTRTRLYIESIEAVLSNTSKIMIDVEGGNNIMYLPLDRLIPERVVDTGSAVAGDLVPRTVEPDNRRPRRRTEKDIRDQLRNRRGTR